MVEIPVYNLSASSWSTSVELDGVSYVLHIAWNDREQAWYLRLHDESDAPILEGVKMVASYPLLSQFHSRENVPTGDLMVVDVEGNFDTARVDFDSLGQRFRLVYLTAEEVASLEL